MDAPNKGHPRIRQANKMRHLRARLGAYRASRPPRQIPREAVPSFFTLMNLLSGFLSLTQTYSGRLDYACWLIVFAAFFDVLDGMMARLAGASSEFGVELDSLSDIVSFGAAPAFIVYAFGLNDLSVLGLFVSALPVLCGAIRLARFNVQADGVKKDHFTGLPIPGQAIILVALILNFDQPVWFNRISLSNVTVLVPIVTFLSLLMVTKIPFDALPKPTRYYFQTHPWKSLAYLVGIILIFALQHVGLLIALFMYLTYSLARALRKLIEDILNYPEAGPSEEAPRTNP